MKMIKKTWEDRTFGKLDDNLVIHFDFLNGDMKPDFSVTVELFWNSDTTDRYSPEQILPRVPSNIAYTFRNGIILKGKLEIRRMTVSDSVQTHGVFAHLYYYLDEGENYVWHTEGFLVDLGMKRPVEAGPKKRVFIDDQLMDVETVAPEAVNALVGSGQDNDLFPYIYVSGWPDMPASEKSWHFFTREPIPVPVTEVSFTAKLASLKTANNRQAMQDEAVSFIEGTAPYTSGYVRHINELTGLLGSFPGFYEVLTDREGLVQPVELAVTYLNTDMEELTAYLTSAPYLATKELLWGSYFALIIVQGYERDNLRSITHVLTLCNFLEIVFSNLDETRSATTLDDRKLHHLLHATLLLDSTIFPLPGFAPSLVTTVPVVPYAIGKLQLVKYRLLRYEAGEVASITSIMPGEKRKLVNRKLDRVTDKETVATTTTTDSGTSVNEQSSDFNEELQQAIAETTETVSYPASSGMTATYGPPTNITVTGSFAKAFTTQKPDTKQLSTFAKKILNRTTQRLSEKINKVRTHTELRESEDTSVSFLKNTHSSEVLYGIHCWLNKVYQASVVHYGNRMLFSFTVPDPAAAYIRQTGILEGKDLTEPLPLASFNVTTYADLKADTTDYLKVCQHYGLSDFPLPPQQSVIVSDVIGLSQSKLIPLPEGYVADTATLRYAFGAGTQAAEVSGFVGQYSFTFDRASGVTGSANKVPVGSEQTAIPVSVVYNPVIALSPPDSGLDFQLLVEISCIPLGETVLAWQIALYQRLAEAYAGQLAAYRLKTRPVGMRTETENPLDQRRIIRQELEKSIRGQLLGHALQVNGLPEAASTVTGMLDQPGILRYLQSALEWNELSYTFFDQYDGQQGEFAVSSLSPGFFSAFLQASEARVLIPVDPAFDRGFLYFLSTGMIWPVGDNLAPCFPDDTANNATNPDQASIVHAIKQTAHRHCYGEHLIDSWELIVPTSMQLLQPKKSFNIKDHGCAFF
jgi:hypothetical protein